MVVATGHPTHVVAGLDLTLVVPFMLLAAVWLWRGQPWGYVLATMLSVKGTAYMLALTAATASASAAGVPDVAAQIPIWILIGAGNLAAALVLLWHVE